MTTRLLLVRHAATMLSADDRFAGATDVSLSVEGRHQAERLRERLSTWPIAAVYASGLQRAVDTATIVAAPHGLPVAVHDGLREVNHGRWEGLRRDEVEALYGGEYGAWEMDPVNAAPSGGESGAAVLARGLEATAAIVQAHPDQTVLVVSHKATIRLVIAHLLGFDVRTYRRRLAQQPACLNVVEFHDPSDARLLLFNDVSHYAGPLAPIDA